MKLFLDVENNKVFAYEDDGSQDHLIPESFKAITQAEAGKITSSKYASTELAVISPVEKLQAFLNANPDVKALLQ